MLDHLVILFRDQTLSDEDLVAFTGDFGELKDPLPASQRAAGVELRANPHVSVIYNFNERPYVAATLHALEFPPSGVDTNWSNMCAALRGLRSRLAPHLHKTQTVGIN